MTFKVADVFGESFLSLFAEVMGLGVLSDEEDAGGGGKLDDGTWAEGKVNFADTAGFDLGNEGVHF